LCLPLPPSRMGCQNVFVATSIHCYPCHMGCRWPTMCLPALPSGTSDPWELAAHALRSPLGFPRGPDWSLEGVCRAVSALGLGPAAGHARRARAGLNGPANSSARLRDPGGFSGPGHAGFRRSSAGQLAPHRRRVSTPAHAVQPLALVVRSTALAVRSIPRPPFTAH
jgi:hypothetical protein